MPYKIPSHRQIQPLRKPVRLNEGKAERDKFYSGSKWEKVRAAFLALNPLCSTCEAEGRLTLATIAHHIVERLDDPERAYDTQNLSPR